MTVASRTLAGIALVAQIAHAQRLAFQSFGVGEGLANSAVSDAFEDSQGFLWIATWEGLSRFDGASFVNYGVRDGLGALLVNSVTEDARGRLWVATNGAGVARLLDAPGRRAAFEALAVGDDRTANSVNVVVFDAQRRMWCSTDGGLYVGTEREGAWSFECAALDVEQNPNSMRTACADGAGRVFAAVDARMFTTVAGELAEFAAPEGSTEPWCVYLDLDHSGRLVAFFERAAFVREDLDPDGGAQLWREIPIELESGEALRCFSGDVARGMWIGTTRGLLRRTPDSVQRFGVRNGLPDDFVRSLSEDRRGGLWIGTNGGGVAHLLDPTLASFPCGAEGQTRTVEELVESDTGMIASLGGGGAVEIAGDRVKALPLFDEPWLERLGGRIARRSDGTWWLGPVQGVFATRGRALEGDDVELVLPSKRVSAHTGFFERADGTMLAGTDENELWSFDAKHEATLLAADLPDSVPRIAESPAGKLWLAGSNWLMRLDGDERLLLEARSGLRETSVRALHFDRRGRLWIGLRNLGLSCCENPDDAEPRFVSLGDAAGLRSGTVWDVCEGPDGTVWLATGSGLHAFAPGVGTLRVWTSADGLAGDVVRDLAFDRKGRLWIATTRGVTRFEPVLAEDDEIPLARILGVRAGGLEQVLAPLGTRWIGELELSSDQRSVEIEFVAPDPRGQARLAYQTMLEGPDEEWSAPGSMRSVRYAQLAPGDYRFLVRATNLVGSHASEAASLSFTIAPPFWRSPPFVALAVAIVAALAWAWHRATVARAVAMERVRRQIALDLHDDLGSGLTQITIHSEIARRDARPDAAERLERVAELARALRGSMDDIVWAVDPRRDSASDLVQRMRKTANAVAELDALAVEFDAPETVPEIELAADRRRHAFLVFKEALNNAVRHSGASRVRVRVAIEPSGIEIEVADDGRGFDPLESKRGRGLNNLAQRAAELGGGVTIDSKPGAGTRVVLRAPWRAPRRGAESSEPR